MDIGKTPEEVKMAARDLLHDRKKFQEVFEKVFRERDRNSDMKINELEYVDFINHMLREFGKKPLNLSVVRNQFHSADKNRDKVISKEEFENQLRSLLEMYSS